MFICIQVKTTSPRKYFVRPNASVVQPWDSCTITSKHACIDTYMLQDSLFGSDVCASAFLFWVIVTLQSQKEYPPDMQSKDKFLIQSTRVAASTDMDEIPPDTVSTNKTHNHWFL